MSMTSVSSTFTVHEDSLLEQMKRLLVLAVIISCSTIVLLVAGKMQLVREMIMYDPSFARFI